MAGGWERASVRWWKKLIFVFSCLFDAEMTFHSIIFNKNSIWNKNIVDKMALENLKRDERKTELKWMNGRMKDDENDDDDGKIVKESVSLEWFNARIVTKIRNAITQCESKIERTGVRTGSNWWNVYFIWNIIKMSRIIKFAVICGTVYKLKDSEERMHTHTQTQTQPNNQTNTHKHSLLHLTCTQNASAFAYILPLYLYDVCDISCVKQYVNAFLYLLSVCNLNSPPFQAFYCDSFRRNINCARMKMKKFPKLVVFRSMCHFLFSNGWAFLVSALLHIPMAGIVMYGKI